MSFQNPWWIDPKKIYEDENVRKAKIFIPPLTENALILGPRQVGKTTFVKTTIKSLLEKGTKPEKILFFSCDSLSKKEELIDLINQYRTLINKDEAHIFLDEITSVKDWNVSLLHLFNAGYFKNSLVYVTGSSSINLYRETLPGRPIHKFIYYPLNFRVYFNTFFKKIIDIPTINIQEMDKMYEYAIRLIPYISELNRVLLEYIKRGGYLATNFVDDPMSLYETYKDAIMTEFFKTNKNEIIFKQIIRKIVESIATRITENSIAKEISISHNTVSDYLEILEKLFIVRVFRKKELNSDRINYKSLKKIYFIDPFLFRVMKRYSLGKDLETNDIPLLIEQTVGEHLSREFNESTFTFFKNGKEIDFVVGKMGVEVKWEKRIRRTIEIPGYILSIDEIGRNDNKITIPTSIFLYLISSDRIFYGIE
ncbi:ATP-binding protein [Sulfolobus tengchongensis]|uniref:ATP-binding protein n=1 Tax=Sulfolobus tengchongensis TaxID=207809 RepID=A0AAX4L3M5_9CREN